MTAAVESANLHLLQPSSSSSATALTRSQQFATAFDGYRSEIDAHNDRRERLIKTSRDVTNLSKKLIFHLHRMPPPSPGSADNVTPRQPTKMDREAQSKIDEIVRILQTVAVQEDLDRSGQQCIRYEKNLGGGLEEFIEAVSFRHFLLHGNLITLDEVQDLFTITPSTTIAGPDGQALSIDPTFLFPVPPHRYLLGISDLTGELMRFATNALAGGGGGKGANDPVSVVRSVLTLLRETREALEPFTSLVQDMRKKQSVTTQSLRKIEDLSYQLSIRTSEFGGDEKAVREMLRRALEGGSASVPVREEDDE